MPPQASGARAFTDFLMAQVRPRTAQHMNYQDPSDIAQKLIALREEHRDLDRAIEQMGEAPYMDQLGLRRMKKRKLKLRDWIAHLESQLIPDIDA